MITLRCRKHPKYQALKEPRAKCQSCWRLWAIMTLSFMGELRKRSHEMEKGERD